MSKSSPETLAGKRLAEFVSNLRFPWLLALTGIVFVLDVFIPDAIPFVDEILFGLVTALLATMKKRKARKR